MKKQIPNIITLCNLLCGVISAYMAAIGQLWDASMFIFLGIFFDFFDGLTARLLGVSSSIGKELDSLADMVTSGVAPGIILYQLLTAQESLPWLGLVALLTPALAAYRLAKFNLDERQHHSFLGLPAPANALIWVGITVAMYSPRYLFVAPLVDTTGGRIALAVLSVITAILMVTELPMFSLKFNFHDLSWRTNSVQYIFLLGCALLIVFLGDLCIAPIILWYIVMSLIVMCVKREKDK